MISARYFSRDTPIDDVRVAQSTLTLAMASGGSRVHPRATHEVGAIATLAAGNGARAHEAALAFLLEDIGEVFDARGGGEGAAVLRCQTLSFASNSVSRSGVRPARSLVWRSEGRVRNQARVWAAVSGRGR